MSKQPAPRRTPPAAARTTALVLSGGGITGFLYEVGVLAALEHALSRPLCHRFGTFVGTSAGAVAAALLANGASATDMYEALFEDRDSPFNFRPRDVFGIASRGLPQLLMQFLAPLFGALGRAVAAGRSASLAAILADFQEHHPPGFYSTEPLEQTLCSRFDALGFAHRFDDVDNQLYVTGTDIDTGERLVFGAGPLGGVHICRAVAASCAIPIFFQPIRMEERDMVDGAIAETTAIDIAVEHGARRILYLNPMVPIQNDRTKLCLPLDGGHCARLSEKGVGWVGEQALRLLLAAKLDLALTALRAGHPELVIHTIHPARDETPMFMHNVMSFAARKELLAYGYSCGERAVAAGSLALLTGAGSSDAPTAA